MAETLVAILTAHLLGDFIFQTSWMVKRKRHLAVLPLHVAIVTLTSWLLLGTLHWPILTIIFLTHLSMDAVKAYMMRDSLASFLIDQAVTWRLWWDSRLPFPVLRKTAGGAPAWTRIYETGTLQL